MRPVRALLLYARLPENETLSYQQAWPRHFAAHPRFDCDPVDVLALRDTRRLRVRAAVRRARYDAVVVAVPHDEFRSRAVRDFVDLLRADRGGVLIDVRGMLDRAAVEAHGVAYWCL